jgi:hypothetical protein
VATPTVFSYTTLDGNGVKASMPFYVSYDGALETIDALVGEWLVYGGLLDAVTGGVILDGQITIPLAPDASWKDTPVAGSDNSDVLGLNYNNDDDINGFLNTVNMLRTALVSAGRPIIASGAIAALIAATIGGFTNGFYVNKAGSNLVSLREAFQADRKHRKQLKAKSTVTP